MLKLCFVLGFVMLIVCIVRDLSRTPVTEKLHFDWEAYNRDVKNGVSNEELLVKLKTGEYYTSDPCRIVDFDRYRYDLAVYGRDIVAGKVRDGEYSVIYKSGDQILFERGLRSDNKRIC